jgi:hypothetical protein
MPGMRPGLYSLLAELAGYAEPGSDQWCTAQFWAGWTARFSSDLADALRHFTELRDAVGLGPSRALADALAGRSAAVLACARSPRQPRMPAVPWPSPARWAIRVCRAHQVRGLARGRRHRQEPLRAARHRIRDKTG